MSKQCGYLLFVLIDKSLYCKNNKVFDLLLFIFNFNNYLIEKIIIFIYYFVFIKFNLKLIQY